MMKVTFIVNLEICIYMRERERKRGKGGGGGGIGGGEEKASYRLCWIFCQMNKKRLRILMYSIDLLEGGKEKLVNLLIGHSILECFSSIITSRLFWQGYEEGRINMGTY